MKLIISLGKDNGKGGTSTISSTGQVRNPIYGNAGILGKDAKVRQHQN